MDRIAVVGSGLVGRSWAISYARAGLHVSLFDQDPAALDGAYRFIKEILPSLRSFDLLNGRSPSDVLALIHREPRLELALEGAGYVQESTPENLEIKRQVFSELERLAPASTILASSTSAILPSRFSEHLQSRERCLVVHPINPPYLVPAVEVVPSPWTSPAVVEAATALMHQVGQAPIVMRREIDGFVMNRMQGALLEEAFRLVSEGYASAEDVDIGIRDGLALRWCFMGPFETIDLNAPGGVRDYVQRYQHIYERIAPSQARRVDWAGNVLDAVEEARRARLPEGELSARQKWRDKRLMALVAHKRERDASD